MYQIHTHTYKCVYTLYVLILMVMLGPVEMRFECVVDEEEADFILLKAFCIQFSTYSCQHARDVAQ